MSPVLSNFFNLGCLCLCLPFLFFWVALFSKNGTGTPNFVTLRSYQVLSNEKTERNWNQKEKCFDYFDWRNISSSWTSSSLLRHLPLSFINSSPFSFLHFCPPSRCLTHPCPNFISFQGKKKFFIWVDLITHYPKILLFSMIHITKKSSDTFNLNNKKEHKLQIYFILSCQLFIIWTKKKEKMTQKNKKESHQKKEDGSLWEHQKEKNKNKKRRKID